MEKKVNNYYKAVAILCFIVASLCIFLSIIGLIGVDSAMEEMKPELINEAITELGYSLEDAMDYVDLVETFTYVILCLCLVCGAVMIVEGVLFNKYSCMDDKTANEKWGKALALTIISFLFGGILIGGLALGGLLSVHKKQKEAFLMGSAQPVSSEEKPQSTGVTLEEIEKAEERLSKLKNLKDANAISDEEYEKLRSSIMKHVVPEVKPDESQKENERLQKLDKLLESGAISEEEYAVLKSSLKK